MKRLSLLVLCVVVCGLGCGKTERQMTYAEATRAYADELTIMDCLRNEQFRLLKTVDDIDKLAANPDYKLDSKKGKALLEQKADSEKRIDMILSELTFAEKSMTKIQAIRRAACPTL